MALHRLYELYRFGDKRVHYLVVFHERHYTTIVGVEFLKRCRRLQRSAKLECLSRIEELDTEPTLAGVQSCLLWLTIEAAVYCGIIKPELSPGLATRNGGKFLLPLMS